MRVFLALAVSPEVKQEIDYLQVELAKITPKLIGHIRWENSADAHITTHFLGDLSNEQIEAVKQAVASAAQTCAPFDFELVKIGGFPSLNFLQTLIIEIKELAGDDSVVLQTDICKKLYEVGVPFDEKPWQPHLTLGRIKNAINENFTALAKVKINSVVWPVTGIELIASELTQAGPRYTVLESFIFGL